jgi:hypothetical protein
MAIQPTRPIYDLLINIQNFETHPYKEGQVYFASDKNQLLVDSNGQRAAQAKLSSIGVLDSVTEIYEKGLKGFEGQILTAKTSNGYRLFYVDNEAQVHNLTFTAEDMSGLVEDGFQGGSLQFTGVWKTSRQYFADELRTSVVKSGSNYYYATATHTSGTFTTDLTDKKWAKFSVQFDSVATNLLLADDAVITTSLTIGTEGTDIGKIRSANASSLNVGSGFYLSNESNGVFRVGNPNSAFLRWDGSSLRAGGFTLTNDNLFASGGNFSVTLSSVFDQSAPGAEDWITPGLENQNELFASLIKREEGIYRFEKEEDIPDFLKQYIGTETLEFKNNAYYFNPLTYDTFGLWNLTVQAIKINQKKIKDLEERLSLLENK